MPAFFRLFSRLPVSRYDFVNIAHSSASVLIVTTWFASSAVKGSMLTCYGSRCSTLKRALSHLSFRPLVFLHRMVDEDRGRWSPKSCFAESEAPKQESLFVCPHVVTTCDASHLTRHHDKQLVSLLCPQKYLHNNNSETSQQLKKSAHRHSPSPSTSHQHVPPFPPAATS